ncbi:MAG: hypothetical protein MK105_00440 [Crocinitomicaceae bacterium]|nr:hypothetical protein [Crocinitomicaceae bacterium]
MQSHLFFICPTDQIEFFINRKFRADNFFYTSLGNSVSFDEEFIRYLKRIILKKKIQRVTFVLTEDNAIVLGAMKTKNSSSLNRMKSFYLTVEIEQDISHHLWRRCDARIVVLCKLLNRKIEELKASLATMDLDFLEIDGKIYSNQRRSFRNIASIPFNRELYHLN